MDRRSLYDDDIYAWTQQQAEALRRLAGKGRDLPNDLDLENVAEEIEDVGKSELHRVESCPADPAASRQGRIGSRRPCGRPLAQGGQDLAHRPAQGFDRVDARQDRSRRGLGGRRHQGRDRSRRGRSGRSGLPGRSPVSVDDLAGDRFDFDEAVERVQAAAARPDPLPR